MDIELNLDIFWTFIKEACPMEYAKFSEWINEYKKTVRWENYFLPEIKFHHIPLMMQIGVMIEYINGQSHNYTFTIEEKFDATDLFTDLQKWFQLEEMSNKPIKNES